MKTKIQGYYIHALNLLRIEENPNFSCSAYSEKKIEMVLIRNRGTRYMIADDKNRGKNLVIQSL
jgi:hypothetical protein